MEYRLLRRSAHPAAEGPKAPAVAVASNYYCIFCACAGYYRHGLSTCPFPAKSEAAEVLRPELTSRCAPPPHRPGVGNTGDDKGLIESRAGSHSTGESKNGSKRSLPGTLNREARDTTQGEREPDQRSRDIHGNA